LHETVEHLTLQLELAEKDKELLFLELAKYWKGEKPFELPKRDTEGLARISSTARICSNGQAEVSHLDRPRSRNPSADSTGAISFNDYRPSRLGVLKRSLTKGFSFNSVSPLEDVRPSTKAASQKLANEIATEMWESRSLRTPDGRRLTDGVMLSKRDSKSLSFTVEDEGKEIAVPGQAMNKWRNTVQGIMDTPKFQLKVEKRRQLAAVVKVLEMQRLHRKGTRNVKKDLPFWLRVCYLIKHPIDPADPFRVSWDALMVLMLVYITITVPYRVAWDVAAENALWYIETFIDIMFIVDIVLNMRTAFIREGKLVTNNGQIFKRYARSWFLIDAISVFPIDYIVTSSPSGLLHSVRLVKIGRLLRLLKMLKLMRLMKVPMLLAKLEAYFSRGVIQLTRFCLVVLVIDHIMACTFYFVSTLDDDEANSWRADSNVLDKSRFTQYVAAIYWSVSTVTTVGYGDVVAVSNIERICSMVLMMVGATVYAYFTSNMNVVVASINIANTRKNQHMAAVNRFLKDRQVPVHVAERVRNYYDYLWQKKLHDHDRIIMEDLSSSLKTDLVLEVYAKLIDKIPLLKGKHPQFITQMVLSLRLEAYCPGDVIAGIGEVGMSMYFIFSGRVAVSGKKAAGDTEVNSKAEMMRGQTKRRLSVKDLVPKTGEFTDILIDEERATYEIPQIHEEKGLEPDSELFDTLTSGQWFGELSMLTGFRRTADVVAVTYCELYCLDRKDLDTILHDWPEVAAEFSLYGESHHTYDLEDIRTRLVDTVSTMSATITPQNKGSSQLTAQHGEGGTAKGAVEREGQGKGDGIFEPAQRERVGGLLSAGLSSELHKLEGE